MSRTRTWNEADPVGAAVEARKIDDEIRAGKVDLREILNQLIGVIESTPLTDPVVAAGLTLTDLQTVQGANSGAVTIVRTLPWYGVRFTENNVTMTKTFYKVTGPNAAGNLYIPVTIPVGVTITRVSVRLFYNSTNHTVATNFYQMNGPTTVTTTTIPTPSPSASDQWVASGVIALLVATDQSFGFEINLNNNNADTGVDLGVYSVRFTFDSPNAKAR